MLRMIFFILILLVPVFSNSQGYVFNNDDEIREFYAFMWPESKNRMNTLNKVDKENAELIALSLIDQSCKMLYVKTLLPNAVTPLGGSLKTLFIRVVRTTFEGCAEKVSEGYISNAVKESLALRWRGPLLIRLDTGEW